MSRPRKQLRVSRSAYRWQYLYCKPCGEITLHRQKGLYAGTKDDLFCKTYTFRCLCGKHRDIGINIDEAMEPVRRGFEYAMAG